MLNTHLTIYRLARLRLSLMAVICVLAAISVLLGTTIARFWGETNGTAQIRIAAFAADAAAVTTGDLSIDYSAAETAASYSFTVSNHKDGITAEVDVGYSVTVTLSAALPDGLTLTLDGISGTASDDGLTYSFEDPAWVLSAGTASTAAHELTFSADSSVLTEALAISKISVSVLAEQVN